MVLLKLVFDNLAGNCTICILVPLVKATPKAITALQQAEIILFGPGSFFTSVLPSIIAIIMALKQWQKNIH